MTKMIILAIVGLVVIALAVTMVVIATKASDGVHSINGQDLIEQSLKIIKALAVSLILLAGGTASGFALTGCVAKRSITVQGTVVHSQSPDSSRVIISSQETYTGRKITH